MFLPTINQRKEALIPATTHPASGPRMNVVSAGLFAAPTLLGVLLTAATLNPFPAIAGALLGVIAAMSPRVAKQWERAVVLRLGRCRRCLMRESQARNRQRRSHSPIRAPKTCTEA